MSFNQDKIIEIVFVDPALRQECVRRILGPLQEEVVTTRSKKDGSE